MFSVYFSGDARQGQEALRVFAMLKDNKVEIEKNKSGRALYSSVLAACGSADKALEILEEAETLFYGLETDLSWYPAGKPNIALSWNAFTRGYSFPCVALYMYM